MEDSSSIDLAQLAKHVDVDVATLQTTIELLDEGNTVPFIARFRRDQTGGLDELRIRTIQRELARFKQLHERKASILKSIESRQQLTPELRDRIQASKTMRVLEDLYLPYKPRKKSLAHIARSRGLAPLAEQIFAAQPGAASIQDVAAGSVDAENELADTDAVLTGVRHLLAEQFCNAADLRSLLRRHMWQNGHLVSKKMDEPEESDGEEPESTAQADESGEETKPDLSENAEPSKEIADDSPQADAEAQPDAGDEAIGPHC